MLCYINKNKELFNIDTNKDFPLKFKNSIEYSTIFPNSFVLKSTNKDSLVKLSDELSKKTKLIKSIVIDEDLENELIIIFNRKDILDLELKLVSSIISNFVIYTYSLYDSSPVLDIIHAELSSKYKVLCSK